MVPYGEEADDVKLTAEDVFTQDPQQAALGVWAGRRTCRFWMPPLSLETMEWMLPTTAAGTPLLRVL